MMAAIDRMRERLQQAGATLVGQRDDGPFTDVTYQVGDLIIRLVSEYGTWRANIGLVDGPEYPASFWITALAGGEAFPDPPVTDEDLSRMVEKVADLLHRGPDVVAQVAEMGEQYAKAMRERLQ